MYKTQEGERPVYKKSAEKKLFEMTSLGRNSAQARLTKIRPVFKKPLREGPMYQKPAEKKLFETTSLERSSVQAKPLRSKTVRK